MTLIDHRSYGTTKAAVKLKPEKISSHNGCNTKLDETRRLTQNGYLITAKKYPHVCYTILVLIPSFENSLFNSEIVLRGASISY